MLTVVYARFGGKKVGMDGWEETIFVESSKQFWGKQLFPV